MTSADDAEFHLVIDRYFDATRDEVFSEWLDASALQDWFAPAGFTGISASVEPVSGGAWEVVYADSKGSRVVESGTFTSIVAPERIEMSLTQDIDGGAKNTKIVVTFTEDSIGTRMRFTQFGLRSIEQRDSMTNGWDSCFDRLAVRLRSSTVVN
jgi:uncharacterized protein YndB with AHSA1/START domain